MDTQSQSTKIIENERHCRRFRCDNISRPDSLCTPVCTPRNVYTPGAVALDNKPSCIIQKIQFTRFWFGLKSDLCLGNVKFYSMAPVFSTVCRQENKNSTLFFFPSHKKLYWICTRFGNPVHCMNGLLGGVNPSPGQLCVHVDCHPDPPSLSYEWCMVRTDPYLFGSHGWPTYTEFKANIL